MRSNITITFWQKHSGQRFVIKDHLVLRVFCLDGIISAINGIENWH